MAAIILSLVIGYWVVRKSRPNRVTHDEQQDCKTENR